MPLLINKPKGMTSHDVVQRVRKLTGMKRVGHAGTLDPLATGLLIVLVGRAETKRQAEFMAGDKEYEAEITLGQVSPTYDAEGPIQASGDPTRITKKDIEMLLPKFVGRIRQQPPAYSAIKRGGQRLYAKARRGTIQSEDIPIREVEIYSLELLTYAPPVCTVRIQCGKGTYIRSLAHDLGQALGCGAYLSELRRTRIGTYTLAQAQSLPIDALPTDGANVNAAARS